MESGDKQYVVDGVQSIMDTSVRVTVVHSNVDVAKEAIGAAFCEMRRVEGLMSVFKEGSEIFLLNKSGCIENVSDETLYVIRKAEEYSILSGGAFAVTVLPLLNLWKKRLDAGTFPTKEEIEEVLPLADYRNVRVEGKRVRFLKANMGVTLGAIAKGYAVDRAVEVLRERGVEHALVNAGGDIKALGDKSKNVPWRIGVRDPRKKDKFLTVVKLEGRAVATSGGYERHIGGKMNVSHIINARTGYPSQGTLSATVIASNTVDADALSTTLFLLGAEEGVRLIEKLDGVEALLVTEDGQTVRSSGFYYYEC